jgi:hypothetical protein
VEESREEPLSSHVSARAFPWKGEAIETLEDETSEPADYPSVAWTPTVASAVDPDYEPVGSGDLAAAVKPVLPAPSGALPKPGGKLPPLAPAGAGGGMSLQEALRAARELQL